MSLRATAALSIASIVLTQLPAASAQQTSTVVVASGTLVPLNLVNPIKHKSTKAGDTVRAQVAFPITVGDQVAIPVGTLFEGTFVAPAKGKKTANTPPVSIHFTRLVYANGYTVPLDATNIAMLTPPAEPQLQAQTADTPTIAQLDLPRLHGPSAQFEPEPSLALNPEPNPDPGPQIGAPPAPTDPYAHNGPTTKELVAFTVGPIAFAGAIIAAFHFAQPHGDYVVEAAGWQFQMTLQNALSVDVARVNAAASTPTPTP